MPENEAGAGSANGQLDFECDLSGTKYIVKAGVRPIASTVVGACLPLSPHSRKFYYVSEAY